MAAPGQICPACRAGQVVYREYSAHGPFLGCSNYPVCKAAWRLDGSRLSGWGGPTSGRSGPMPLGRKRQEGGDLVGAGASGGLGGGQHRGEGRGPGP